jgi:acyl-coenzyme A synthetase/AMP-(fatty) acid ligase
MLPLEVQPGAPLVLQGGERVTRADVRQRSTELESCLRHRGVTRLLVASDQPARILSAIDAAGRLSADLWIAHTDLSSSVIDEIVREHRIGLILEADRENATDIAPEPASSRLCLMTSGTTGRPKLASYAQEPFLDRFAGQPRQSTLSGSRWLLTYQPTTFAGLQVLLTAVYGMGILVIPDERTPPGFFEAAQHHAVTHISGTPTFWRSLLMMMTPGSLPDVRQATLGGEAIDQATLDRIRRSLPRARITHIYASTEAGVVFAVNDGQAGFPATWITEGVQGSQLRIRDGLLEVNSPRRMLSYLGQSAATPFIEDSWLRTADRVAIDGERVHFLGRLDTVINVGGAKVDPFSVEAFLLGLEGVTEVRVFGLRNQLTGFVVAADVVLAPGVGPDTARQRILSECYQRLPRTHVPRVLRIVDVIPVLESGKKAV